MQRARPHPFHQPLLRLRQTSPGRRGSIVGSGGHDHVQLRRLRRPRRSLLSSQLASAVADTRARPTSSAVDRSSTATKNSARSLEETIPVLAGAGSAFKRCCMLGGRYDGANRNDYFQGLIFGLLPCAGRGLGARLVRHEPGCKGQDRIPFTWPPVLVALDGNLELDESAFISTIRLA